MEICIITPTFFPEPGGPSAFVDNFVNSLIKDGHRVTVIAISESPDLSFKAENYLLVKISRKQLRIFRVLKTIFSIIQLGRKSDLIFSCGLFLESAISKLIIRKPLIIRIGGDPVWEKWTNQEGMKADLDEFYKNRYSPKIEFKKYLQKVSCKLADRVITPCYFFKSLIEKWKVKPEKIEVVYNGVNVENMNLPPKEKLKRDLFLLQEKTVILTIGRLIEFKRIDEIIKSFSEIKTDHLYLYIIGEGFKKDELIALCKKLDILDRVNFLGIKNHNEVLQYLRAADLFVLNSIDEVMPNVVLESLAVGTPVIAPNGGGIPEIIQDQVDGLLFPLKRGNKDELKETIEKLLWDEELKQVFIKNGFLKINQFNWKKTYKKIMSVINYNL